MYNRWCLHVAPSCGHMSGLLEHEHLHEDKPSIVKRIIDHLVAVNLHAPLLPPIDAQVILGSHLVQCEGLLKVQ